MIFFLLSIISDMSFHFGNVKSSKCSIFSAYMLESSSLIRMYALGVKKQIFATFLCFARWRINGNKKISHMRTMKFYLSLFHCWLIPEFEWYYLRIAGCFSIFWTFYSQENFLKMESSTMYILYNGKRCYVWLLCVCQSVCLSLWVATVCVSVCVCDVFVAAQQRNEHFTLLCEWFRFPRPLTITTRTRTCVRVVYICMYVYVWLRVRASAAAATYQRTYRAIHFSFVMSGHNDDDAHDLEPYTSSNRSLSLFLSVIFSHIYSFRIAFMTLYK